MISIIDLLKSGKKYSFFSDMFEPQYNHAERVSINIHWDADRKLFVRKYSYFLQTKDGLTEKESEDTFTEIQLVEELKTVKPDFWGQGFWTADHVIDSEEKIKKFISG